MTVVLSTAPFRPQRCLFAYPRASCLGPPLSTADLSDYCGGGDAAIFVRASHPCGRPRRSCAESLRLLRRMCSHSAWPSMRPRPGGRCGMVHQIRAQDRPSSLPGSWWEGSARTMQRQMRQCGRRGSQGLRRCAMCCVEDGAKRRPSGQLRVRRLGGRSQPMCRWRLPRRSNRRRDCFCVARARPSTPWCGRRAIASRKRTSNAGCARNRSYDARCRRGR